MQKKLSDAYLTAVANEELEILDCLMDYVERMIREGCLEYRSLRREAYGKTVCIVQENGQKDTYRLGMDSLTYPKKNSGYATPHSPIGRLCSVVSLGYQGYSIRWGDYRVNEVRRFRRHDFEELDKQVRNFRAMLVENDKGASTVENLRALVAKLLAPRPESVVESDAKTELSGVNLSSVEPAPPSLGETALVASGVEAEQPREPLQPALILEILDDEDDAAIEGIITHSDLDMDGEPEEFSEYIGLDEDFFLNRTWAQDKIISRSPVGPMWVEGVAGSGKTSAALGRTKMLCDFNSNVVSDSEMFRQILGDEFDYWEGRFAGKFSQEGCVGFVRTAELILYLKETCSRLGMANLPVMEYHELRSRLRNHRKLESSGGPVKRFKHSSEDNHPLTSTLQWLDAASFAVAQVIARDLRAQVSLLSSSITKDLPANQLSLLTAAIELLSLRVEELSRAIENPVVARGVLSGLVVRLQELIQKVESRILGTDVLTIQLGGKLVYGTGQPELAKGLIEQEVDFFLDPNTVLVLYQAPTDSGLGEGVKLCVSSSGYEFFDTARQGIDLAEALQCADQKEPVRVKIPALTDVMLAFFMPANELFMRLGHSVPLLFLNKGGLKRIRIKRGLGRIAAEGTESSAKMFSSLAREKLVKPLKNFAYFYAKALEDERLLFPDQVVAQQVLERLQTYRLCDADIDLLLCIAHDIAFKSEKGSLPSGLLSSSYYQSVFIDEVQDFTEQQIYLMTSQADPEYHAITVVGDRSQQLLRNEQLYITDCFPGGLRPEFVRLDENLRQRSQPELADFSALLRKLFETGTDADLQMLDTYLLHDQVNNASAYSLQSFADREQEFAYLCDIISNISEDLTVAVVLPDQALAFELHNYCEQRLEGSFRKMSMSEHINLAKKYLVHFTSVLHVKGLEFDVVLLPMIERYDLAQPIFRNRLYVGCTRARKSLVMSRLTHSS